VFCALAGNTKMSGINPQSKNRFIDLGLKRPG